MFRGVESSELLSEQRDREAEIEKLVANVGKKVSRIGPWNYVK